MNVGLCMPEPGFLKVSANRHQKWRAPDLRRSENRRQTRLGRRVGILQREARHDLLAKSIGGGLALAAFGASKSVMD